MELGSPVALDRLTELAVGVALDRLTEPAWLDRAAVLACHTDVVVVFWTALYLRLLWDACSWPPCDR